MLTSRPIRHRLLIVAALSVFTAALSGVALYRAIAATTTQRIERAREAISEELGRLRSAEAGVPDASSFVPSVVGMRGGRAASASEIVGAIPALWRPDVEVAARRAASEGRPTEVEAALSAGHLVARIVPVGTIPSNGRLAWAAMLVRPSPTLQSWRALVVALTLSALLLVVAAASALISVKRGASALRAAITALAKDLSAPIPRTSVREFGDIADGIASLAGHLADARRIQERLGQDLARQERLVALGRVVAGVAHEVRNPLASIKLRLDLAMADTDSLPSGLRTAIAHASSEIMRLDRLVADLLIVSGRPLGPRQVVAAGALLRARMETLGPWAAQKGVRLHARGDGNALADADGLARAMDNLIHNAVDASSPGTVVEGVVDCLHQRLRIRVEDRGSGVPSGRVGELFEPFFTTKPEGTGLGLAISRAIARAHGGDLVYGRSGEVTQFDLTLPAVAPEIVPAGIANQVSA